MSRDPKKPLTTPAPATVLPLLFTAVVVGCAPPTTSSGRESASGDAPDAPDASMMQDADVSEPPASARDVPPPSDVEPCYADVEFPVAYCDVGTVCAEGACQPIAPCREVRCDEETLVCVGELCDAPVDDPGTSEPPPPPPPPPPAEEPPPPPTYEVPTTSRVKIRMDWDSAGDMDLHLLNPTATRWNGHEDCFFANCLGVPLEWGVPGAFDNPRLSEDVVTRRGPERIVIDHPQPGMYRVGVDAFDGRSNVTVRIECGAGPRVRVFGPVNVGRAGARFWRVADIEIGPAGGCRIHPLTPQAAGSRSFSTR